MNSRYLARTIRGLEWIAAAEIEHALPGISGIQMGSREVAFQLDLPDPALTKLQTVDDVFVVVGELTNIGKTKADVLPLAMKLTRLDWRSPIAALAPIREVPARPRFDVVASLEGRRTYNRFDVENTAGRLLQNTLSGTHLPRTSDNVRPVDPDLTVRLFLRDTTAVVALRLGQRPLHRRQYKHDTGPGTLHPPVAAMLALLANPAAGEVVADPFCGDGTIAIEAALLQTGANIIASDIDADRVANARRNAKRAHVDVEATVTDAGALAWHAGSIDAVVTNPPWNVVVAGAGDLRLSLDPFWKRVSSALTSNGRLCVIADADLKVPDQLERLGYSISLATQIRLAGRVSEVVLAGRSEADRPQLPADMARWRDRARHEGIVTEEGW